MSAALDNTPSTPRICGSPCTSRVGRATVAQLVEQLIRNQSPCSPRSSTTPQPLSLTPHVLTEGNHKAHQLSLELTNPNQSVTFRRCRKCGNVKPLAAFYRDKNSIGGHRWNCKECHRRQMVGYYREYAERHRAAVSSWAERNPERKQAVNDAYRRRHPDRQAARRQLQRAIRAGRISRGPCAVCGTTVDIHGHHEDYSKPLDVIWLCGRHHREYHAGQIQIEHREAS